MRQAHTMISYGGVISFNLYITFGEGGGVLAFDRRHQSLH